MVLFLDLGLVSKLKKNFPLMNVKQRKFNPSLPVWSNNQKSSEKYSQADRFQFLIAKLYPHHLPRLESSIPESKDASKTFSDRDISLIIGPVSSLGARVKKALGSLAVPFIGLLVQHALDYQMEQCDPPGPLKPMHYRIAYMRLIEKGILPNSHLNRDPFPVTLPRWPVPSDSLPKAPLDSMP